MLELIEDYSNQISECNPLEEAKIYTFQIKYYFFLGTHTKILKKYFYLLSKNKGHRNSENQKQRHILNLVSKAAIRNFHRG